jgi:hypothetical protein
MEGQMNDDFRRCLYCGEQLFKRPYERPSQFDRRQTCTRRCAGKLAIVGVVPVEYVPDEPPAHVIAEIESRKLGVMFYRAVGCGVFGVDD